ncbi:MAG: hypothetical protein MJ065_00640 [Oscillospiraceae bacterium]|nr:hypothetical protein [Oscillospiraceae bacterium]
MKIIPLLLIPLLLTGCTDIRRRLSPDLLTVHTGKSFSFAAHTSQEDALIAAEAADPLLMTEALGRAAGAEISTGHLTMLAVSGDPCGVTETYLQAQDLAPTCTVLAVDRNACDALRSGSLPTPAQIEAAVKTGMLPCRTADTVIGDLWGGSGVTALTACRDGALGIALYADGQCCGMLSEDACRGLALLSGQYETFAFDAAGTVFRVLGASLKIGVHMADKLEITVSGEIRTEPPLTDAAETRLAKMLGETFRETVCIAGADLLFLREAALRDGLASVRSCSQSAWRDMLMKSEYRIALPLR